MGIDVWPFNNAPSQKAAQGVGILRDAILDVIDDDWYTPTEIYKILDLGAIVGGKFRTAFVTNILEGLVREGAAEKDYTYRPAKIGSGSYSRPHPVYRRR